MIIWQAQGTDEQNKQKNKQQASKKKVIYSPRKIMLLSQNKFIEVKHKCSGLKVQNCSTCLLDNSAT